LEDRVDAVGRHDDLLLADPVVLYEVAFRALGHDKHALCTSSRTRDERAEHEAVAAAHQLRVRLEREVVDGDDGGPPIGGRHDVVEVAERRAESSECSWEAERHPGGLAPRRKLEGADPFRDELRAAGDRDEPFLVRNRDELAEERRDVRLVAGAPTAEYVGIDRDQRLHPASSL
jgi:hypothetical protein